MSLARITHKQLQKSWQGNSQTAAVQSNDKTPLRPLIGFQSFTDNPNGLLSVIFPRIFLGHDAEDRAEVGVAFDDDIAFGEVEEFFWSHHLISI